MRNTDPAFVRDLGDEKIEALVEVMYLAAAADGELGDEELAEFKKSADRLTSGLARGEALDELLGRARDALESSSREARLASVRDRLPDAELRKLALSLAIKITAADGILRTSERELILDTAEALGVDGDTAADMVRAASSR